MNEPAVALGVVKTVGIKDDVAPLATPLPLMSRINGAATRDRTPDLLITNELLYQLSYGGAPTTGETRRKP